MPGPGLDTVTAYVRAWLIAQQRQKRSDRDVALQVDTSNATINQVRQGKKTVGGAVEELFAAVLTAGSIDTLRKIAKAQYESIRPVLDAYDESKGKKAVMGRAEYGAAAPPPQLPAAELPARIRRLAAEANKRDDHPRIVEEVINEVIGLYKHGFTGDDLDLLASLDNHQRDHVTDATIAMVDAEEAAERRSVEIEQGEPGSLAEVYVLVQTHRIKKGQKPLTPEQVDALSKQAALDGHASITLDIAERYAADLIALEKKKTAGAAAAPIVTLDDLRGSRKPPKLPPRGAAKKAPKGKGKK